MDVLDNDSMVLFVHGLGGRRYGSNGTWGRFPELVFENLSSVDIGLYSYVSLLGRLRLGKSVEPLIEAETLAGVISQASGYRRIVLVGHSMGGIICMAAVRRLIEAGDFDKAPSVTGLILLATPQAGSLRVPWLLRRLTPDTRALTAHGTLVAGLHQFFVTNVVQDGSPAQLGRFSLPTWALLGSSDRWVDTLSASLGLPASRVRRVRGSHTDIVKPSSPEADSFLFLKACLENVLGGSPHGEATPELPLPDPVPGAGRLLDRIELREELRQFASVNHRRSIILLGPPGWGKKELAANFVNERKEQFAGVLWINCHRSQGVPSTLLALLNGLFQANGETCLDGYWQNTNGDRLERALKRLLPAFGRSPYLVVLRALHEWLEPSGTFSDEGLGRIVHGIVTAAGHSKLVITSQIRPSWNLVDIPLEALTVAKVGGLDEDSSIDLLKHSGLDFVPSATLLKAARRYGGMPVALRIFAQLVTQGGHDPEAVLDSADVGTVLNSLLMESMADLPESVRGVFELVSVFRAPTSSTILTTSPRPVAEAIQLLDSRGLIEHDRAAGTIHVVNVIRASVLNVMDAAKLRNLNEEVARLMESDSSNTEPASVEQAKVGIERSYYWLQAGDEASASVALAAVTGALLHWGYADLARVHAEPLLAAARTKELAAPQARAAFVLGEVADIQGRYLDAEEHFRLALLKAEESGFWSLVSTSLYRLGRIASSNARIDEAEKLFALCIQTCKAHGVTEGWAGSLLSGAWSARESGRTPEEVLQLLEDARKRAVETADRQIEASAERELGFDAWTARQDETTSRGHLQKALELCQRHALRQELGAVHTTLGFLEVQWNQPDSAIAHSWAAVELARTLGDEHMLASAYDHLGLAWEHKGDVTGAADWYARALALEREIANPSGQIITNVHLARTSRKLGLKEQAEDHLLAAQLLVAKHGITSLLPRIEEEVALGGSK
jgi:tetratricopeptide (TPR) repeat protein/pimeloyl-ACP methyl ester carboxylesterase